MQRIAITAGYCFSPFRCALSGSTFRRRGFAGQPMVNRCRPQKVHPDDSFGTSRDYWILCDAIPMSRRSNSRQFPSRFSVSF